MQIICICPDICAFSVLHHRHLSDICAFCQKCQFEVKKGWQVLLLQSKAEDMHCKQADSAILKLLLVQASMRQIYFISKQTYVVITCFCRNMGYVAFTRILSRIAFCHKYALFWFCFVQTFTQTFRIWLRFCADIWTKNWRLRPLVVMPTWCWLVSSMWSLIIHTRYLGLILSLRDQKLAHKFHKAHMGNRYLEVFEARYSEMSWMLTKNVDKNPKDANKMAEYEEFVSFC